MIKVRALAISALVILGFLGYNAHEEQYILEPLLPRTANGSVEDTSPGIASDYTQRGPNIDGEDYGDGCRVVLLTFPNNGTSWTQAFFTSATDGISKAVYKEGVPSRWPGAFVHGSMPPPTRAYTLQTKQWENAVSSSLISVLPTCNAINVSQGRRLILRSRR